MTQTQLLPSPPVVELVDLGPLQWLMIDRMEALTRTLTTAQGWSVGRHVNYDGDAILVATHEARGQTFVLCGEGEFIELSRLCDDRLVACGTFKRMDAALDALRQAAEREQV